MPTSDRAPEEPSLAVAAVTTAGIHPALLDLPADQALEAACRAHLGVWSERKLGLTLAPVHWAWCDLRMEWSRGCVVAPREHGKSVTFAVNGTVWESLNNPGLWTYIFSATLDQAKALLGQIKATMEVVAPLMVAGAFQDSMTQVEFANGSMVTVAGAGKSVRGAHPDRIIGDDVLDEESSLSELGRKRTQRWWMGSIGGMAHPGTTRKVRTRWWDDRRILKMDPTRMWLVGTPFHDRDLLMTMRTNPVWRFHRYAAEFDPALVVPGTLAVEVG
jgi:hypothetical protein